MQIQAVRRTFKFNGEVLRDINPNLTPERVKDIYAVRHTELTTAVISEPVMKEDGSIEYTFTRSIGAKG